MDCGAPGLTPQSHPVILCNTQPNKKHTFLTSGIWLSSIPWESRRRGRRQAGETSRQNHNVYRMGH
jgi:hypothetical protein